jgi:hypothetical protein
LADEPKCKTVTVLATYKTVTALTYKTVTAVEHVFADLEAISAVGLHSFLRSRPPISWSGLNFLPKLTDLYQTLGILGFRFPAIVCFVIGMGIGPRGWGAV